MDDIRRIFERAILNSMREKVELPEEIWLMIDSLIEAGCPMNCVLQGMKTFAEKMSLMELLKDVKIEEEK